MRLAAATLRFFRHCKLRWRFFSQGFDNAAHAWLERAKTLTPDNLLLDDLQMEILLSNGAFEEVLEITAPDSGASQRAVYNTAYGEAFLALGRTNDARDAFENAIAKTEDAEADGAYELSRAEKLLSTKSKRDD